MPSSSCRRIRTGASWRALALPHPAGDGLGDEKGALDVDVEGCVKVGLAQISNRTEALDADDMRQAIDGAELPLGRGDEGFDRGAAGHVHRLSEDVAAKLLRQRLQARPVDVGEREAHPGRMQLPRNSFANPLRGPGDHPDGAAKPLKFFRHCPISSSWRADTTQGPEWGKEAINLAAVHCDPHHSPTLRRVVGM